jgi:hypothetical protein
MKNFTPASDTIRFAIIDDLLSAKPKAKLGRCPHGPPVVEKVNRWCGRYNKYRDQYTDLKEYDPRGKLGGAVRADNGYWGYTIDQLFALGFVTAREAVNWHSEEQRRRTGKGSSWKAVQRRENRLEERVWNKLRNTVQNGQMPGIYEVTVRWDRYGYIPATCRAEAEQLAHTLLVTPLGLDASRVRISWEAYATHAKLTELQANVADIGKFDRQIADIRARRDKEIAALEERKDKVSLALAMTMGLLDLDEEDTY